MAAKQGPGFGIKSHDSGFKSSVLLQDDESHKTISNATDLDAIRQDLKDFQFR